MALIDYIKIVLIQRNELQMTRIIANQLNLIEDTSEKKAISENFISGETLINDKKYPTKVGEFWTSKQRQASSLQEVSYRACFKPQLPRYFIEIYTGKNDVVYDPFGGRGTTALEAALLGRKIIQNDINPISEILSKPRLAIPTMKDIEERLNDIPFRTDLKSDIDLSMFFEENTLNEILSFKDYFIQRNVDNKFDDLDAWIRMVATNRLTGHSSGFFSVYTFPPNQAISAESQIKINEKRGQIPTYRDTKKIILKKTKQLISDLTHDQLSNLRAAKETAIYLNKLANQTSDIPDNSVDLVVTSPPFLDIVQYKDDNWMRCWFNNLDADEIGKKITMSRTVDAWASQMKLVLAELFRVIKFSGIIAFEVGEIRNGRIKLEEVIAPLGEEVGLKFMYIMINSQEFTKTSNIWGVGNNKSGTNSNRIVVFGK